MRAALFDLDETLLDRTGSLRDFVTWQATSMLRSSINDTQLFIERFIALDQKGMVWKDKVYEALVNEFNITDWSVEELLNVYVLTFCAFCKPRHGALAAIEEFRSNGFKIGLVSNGMSPFQERNFQALGFCKLFDNVIVSEAVGLKKPNKEIFELGCSTLSADISSSVFIGDNPVADIKGAKNAGMITIYTPVDAGAATCTHADTTVTDLSALIGYVNRGR